MKHGLFTWGATAEESYKKHMKCVDLAAKYVVGNIARERLTPRNVPLASPSEAQRILCTIRGLLHDMDPKQRHWIVRRRVNADVLQFTHSEEAAVWSQQGTITPDHVIRTKPRPLLLRNLYEGHVRAIR